ncbi:addiction module protein [Leptospira sp. 96542]|nr:addiction module protein [Leptospira sp. 96542]
MTTTDIKELSLSEKLRLMEALWDSLRDEGKTMESPAWHADVLAERLNGVSRGEDLVSDWNEARERVRAQVRGT